VLVIKLCGVAVFVAAVLVGVGLLLTKPGLYFVAIGLSGAALLTVILSALPWRRRPPRYP
jgi:threonine/homoserine/homoserine lactone efflux protein